MTTLARWTAACLALLLGGCSPAAEPTCGEGELETAEGCVPEICGAGPFHGEGGGDLHVSTDGSDTADGSPEAPLASLDEAFDRLEEAGGGRLLLGAGTWRGAWTLPATEAGIELVGRCPALTVLEGADDARVLRIEGPARVAELSTVGGRKAIRLEPGAGSEDEPVLLHDLEVRDATWVGVYVEEAHALLERVAVGGVSMQVAGDPYWGHGIWLGGGSATVLDSTFSDCESWSIRVQDEARLQIEDVEITRGGGVDCATGEVVIGGLSADQGPMGPLGTTGLRSSLCPVTARDIHIEGYQHGISSRTAIELQDVTIRDVEYGISSKFDGYVTGSELLLERCTGACVHTFGHPATIELEDVTIRDGAEPGRFAYGAAVQWGGRIRLERALIEEIDGRGGWIYSPLEASLELVDSTIRNITSPGIGNGTGILATGGTVLLDGVEISDTEGPALVAQNSLAIGSGATMARSGFAGVVSIGGVVDLEGLEISAPVDAPGNEGGFGLYATGLAASDGSTTPPDVRLQDFEITGTDGPALYLVGPGSYRFLDGAIEQGGSGPLPGGLFATEGVEAWSGDDGLLLSDVEIRDVRRDCVLLDDASATLEGVACAGQDGEPLWWQRCEAVQEPVIEDSPGLVAECREYHRQTRPLATFNIEVEEPALAD